MNYLSKMMEVAQAHDAAVASPPQGVKVLGRWAIGGPLPGYPVGTGGLVVILEADTTEAVAAFWVPIALAGAPAFWVPAIELPTEAVKMVEEFRR